jgi:outer membrane cobalamin receptor
LLIKRPAFRDLDPFFNLTDPHDISTGNPNLQPEIRNKIEFGYSKSYESGANINIIANYAGKADKQTCKPTHWLFAKSLATAKQA